MNAPVFEVQNFSFAAAEKPILKDISFFVRANEYLSIIGPNGAGKTTLLKCLNRIWPGGTGSILLFGKQLEQYTQKEIARFIGYVPQAGGLSIPFSVEEFALMGRYPHLGPFASFGKADRDIVHAALALTGMEGFAHRMMDTLSGGERQKVLIAAALTGEAKILLLDEPTTFLDPHHCADIQTRLRRVNREWGVTVIAVTHDLNSAALSSDRILALKDGSVAFCGPADEVMDNSALRAIYDMDFLFVNHPQTGKPVVVQRSPHS